MSSKIQGSILHLRGFSGKSDIVLLFAAPQNGMYPSGGFGVFSLRVLALSRQNRCAILAVLDYPPIHQETMTSEQTIQEAIYRVVIVRSGSVVAEWAHGVAHDKQWGMASAAKSIYSSALAIAIEEGKIGSADDRVVDDYPVMMDVPDGTGPKPGRYAFEKDRAITFRQLISNTSGYMKPGEEPGAVVHYQTFGMNILCHAIATAYGFWDVADLILGRVAAHQILQGSRQLVPQFRSLQVLPMIKFRAVAQ